VEHFNMIPLYTSLTVALGGLLVGWWVYRDIPEGAEDPLKKVLGPVHTLLQNKYYFDEAYDFLFIKPAYWLAETFTYKWIDRGIIDGILHAVARFALWFGHALRNDFDLPVINRFIGDGSATVVRKSGFALRKVETGRVQQYMVAAMSTLIVVGALLYFFLA